MCLTVGNNGLILKSANEGKNWQVIEPDTTANLLTVDFVNDSTAFIGGDSGTLLSVNISTNQKEFYTVNSNLPIRRIEFVNVL